MDLQKIGPLIKAKRLEKHLSIKDLTQLSNVAGGTISQIETGKVSPNLLTLKAICDALHIPVFSLFLEESADKIRLVRNGEQQTFIRNMSNGKPLTESLIIQGKNEMYAATIDIPPHTDSGDYAHHGGEEFVFILKGEILYDLEDNRVYALSFHDTLYYMNHIGHRWENNSDKPAQMLLVSTSPYNF